MAIDISNPESVKVVKRVADVFPYRMFPPFENVKFECPDPRKAM
ncbi:MAG: hypothetical protein ACI9V1_003268 [Spirosomataceae bacterium]